MTKLSLTLVPAVLFLSASFNAFAASQTITFAPIPDQLLNSAPFPITVAASSGLPIAVYSNTPGVCTISGTLVTPASPGTCSLTARQDGSSNYDAAPPVIRIFTVGDAMRPWVARSIRPLTSAGPQPQAITFSSQGTVLTGNNSFGVSVSASSGLAVDLVSNNTNICSTSGTTVFVSTTGTCSITASQAGNSSYLAAPPVTQNFYVNTASFGQVSCGTLATNPVFVRIEGQTEQVADVTLNCYGTQSATMNLSVYLSPAVAITSANVSSSNGVVSESTAGVNATGTTFASGAIPGAATGSVASFTGIRTPAGSFSVTITNIKVNASQAATSSGAPIAITETIFMSGTNVTPAVLSAATVAYAVTGLSGIQAMDVTPFPACSISAATPAFNFQFGEAFPNAFQSQGSASINSTLGSWVTNGTETGYGIIASGDNTATSGTRVQVTFTGIPSGVTAYVPLALTSNGGVMKLTASANGAFSTVPASTDPAAPASSAALAVNAGSAVAIYEETTSSPIASEIYTLPLYLAGNPAAGSSEITAAISFAPTGNSSNVPSFVASDSFSAEGSYTFQACGAGTAQTISFPPLPNVPLTAGSVTLSATASSGLPVSYTSVSIGANACSVGGNVVALNAAGTCTITANQGGNGTYAAASPVTRAFTITANNTQTITFGPLNNVATGTPSFTITATSTSGLPVALTSNTSSVCTVSGTAVTVSGTGTCSITASQGGNGIYLAASQVTQTFQVVINSGPATCAASAQAVFVRAEGTSEQLADTTLSCTGGNALPLNITIYLSPAVSITSAAVNGQSEVIAGLQATSSSYATGGVVSGVVSGNTVTFSNVPTTSGTFTVTISNLRINASQIAASAVPTPVTENIFLDGAAVNPGTLNPDTVAYVTDGLTGVIATGIGSIPICHATTAAGANFNVQFSEGFSNAFKVQGSSASNSTIGSWFANGTETGYGVSSGGTTNTATAGTRVKIAFGNVPTGAALYVPLTISSNGGIMMLTQNETGPFSAVAASGAAGAPADTAALSASGGSATAVYEETTTSTANIETYKVPVYLVAAAGSISASDPPISATVSLAPVNASGSVPDFVSGVSTVTLNGSSFIPCGTGAATQTITFAPLSNTVSGTVALSATASSGLPVSFSTTTPGVCTISSSSVIIAGAGQCSVTASQGGNADYAAAIPVTQSFIAGAGNAQSITFSNPGNQANGNSFTLIATASSGLPVSFTSTTLSVCTVSGVIVRLIATGTCSIQADQAGNGTFAAAISVTQGFQSINVAGPTNGCSASANAVFVRNEGKSEQVADTAISCMGNGLPMNLTVYLSPDVSITSKIVGSAGSEALAGPTATFGTAAVAGAVSGSAVTFTNVPTSAGITTITLTNIRIDASQIATSMGAPTAVTETIFVGGNNVTPAVLNSFNVAYATNGLGSVTATGANPLPVCSAISAASPAFSVHFAEQFSTAFKTQGSASQNFSLGSEFTNSTETGYGVTSGAVSNTATSGTRVKIVFSNVPAGITLSVPLTISNNGGTMTLTSSEAGPFSAVPASGVNVAALPIANHIATAIYEETIAAPTVIETYTVPVYLSAGASTIPSQASAITATVSFAPIGATSNVPNFINTASTTVVTGSTLPPCGSMITFSPLSNVTFGVADSTLSASSSSGLPVTFASTTPSVCTVSSNTLSIVAGGSCSITASQAANNYYSAATDVTQSFTVSPAIQTISFSQPTSAVLGSGTVTLSAAASSGLALTYSSQTTSICTVSGAIVTLLHMGNCQITANQAGNASYQAASMVHGFTVLPGSQLIRFDPISAQILGSSPFPVFVQSNSGLTVGLTSATTSVCTVTGRIVTLLSAGNCSLNATQAGNGDYNAANSVNRSFTVSTASPSGTLVPGPGPYATAGNSTVYAVVTGDFNGDGFADIAAAGYDGTITILLGTGQGSFSTGTATPVNIGATPGALVVGDFNGDGSLDLAVAAAGSGSISVFLGNGTGAFSLAASPFSGGAGIRSMAIADFNGDGIQDLIVADSNGTVPVFLGNGAGAFTASANSPVTVGSSPIAAIAVGDFNRDGKQDFAAVSLFALSNNVTIMIGDGAGGFSAASGSPYSVAAYANAVAVADFNKDGKPDLIVSSINMPNGPGGMASVFIGDGAGGFSPSAGSPYQLSLEAGAVVTGDFNGDGNPDAALGGGIGFLIGDGTGGFTLQQPAITPQAEAVSLVGGDFNGDGLEDLIAGRSISDHGISVFLGSLAGTTSTLTTTSDQMIASSQSVPLALTLSNSGWSFNPPTGTVTFSDGMSVLGTVTQSPYTFTAINLAPGTHSFTASYSGDSRNAASISNSVAINVAQSGTQSQTITFNAPAAVTLPTSSVTLAATATSGLTVTFASSTTSVCTVSGATVTPVAAGTCTIVASQAGNSTYAAAPPVTQSFAINPAPSTGGGGGSGGGGSAGGGGGGTPLVVSPASVTITAPAGGAKGTATVTLTYQTFTQGAPSFSSNFNTNQGQGWLSVSPASGTMALASTSGLQFNYSASITISGDPTNLAAGAFTGTVNISAAGSIVSVPVTFNINANAAKYTVAPQAMEFNYQQGSSAQPVAQSLSVFSTPSGGAFTAAATSSGNWLSIGAGGTAPASLAVSVNTSGLQPNTYTGNIAITWGSSTASAPNSINVPVTLTVTKANPPVLSLSPLMENFSATEGGSAFAGQITVSNAGGRTLQFTATSDQSWLSTASSGSATPSAPASLAFTVDPSKLRAGVYTGHIAVSDANSPAQAVSSIVLTVTNTAARIQISQTGIAMTSVAGGAAPQSQTVQISNSGSGTLNWTAQTSTTSGSNWLSATQNSGSVTISANTNGLAAGQYYGSVNILSANATNSPQTIAVALNVVAVSATPGIAISSGGILLEGAAGSTTVVSQAVNLYSASSSAVTYSASTFTQNGGSWLSVSAASGSLNTGTNSITISADLSQIAGVQQGSVTLAFGDGTSASIQVVAVAYSKTGNVAAGIRPLASIHSLASVSACAGGKASYLIPIFRQPSAGSSVQVSLPSDVQVQVIDDCGNAVTAAKGGAVQVTFGNGDPGLTLNDVGSGIWEATWVPQNAAKSASLQISASENGLSVGSSVSMLSTETVTVLAAGNNAPPAPTGIANAASAGQATPQVVAPGSYVAIYGTNLGGPDNPNAASLPLPTALNGVQLFLGGQPMPLLYAGTGQVNALVPEGLAPNATYPLIVLRGTVQSVPVPITVTELQPGAYTVNTSGSGAGIVTNALTGQLITNSNPAHAGDYLVIYATGLGALTGGNGEVEPSDGAAAPGTTIYHTNAQVSVNIGGVTIPAAFAGLTPTFAGLYQVNVQVPQGVTTGSTVPVTLSATDAASGVTSAGNTVTIAIQ